MAASFESHDKPPSGFSGDHSPCRAPTNFPAAIPRRPGGILPGVQRLTHVRMPWRVLHVFCRFRWRGQCHTTVHAVAATLRTGHMRNRLKSAALIAIAALGSGLAPAQQISASRLAGGDDDDQRRAASGADPKVRRQDRTHHASRSKPYWPPRVEPPKGAPNVLLIMTDDAGFGVPSTFGGVIPTPTLDRIADRGPALHELQLHGTVLAHARRADHRAQSPLGRASA